VQFDGLLVDTIFGEKVGYLNTLITLKLDDLTHLLVIDECTVAGEFLDVSISDGSK
jgi:hypothetical protein